MDVPLVLVVEDHEPLSRLVATVLGRAGDLRILCARDGNEAVEIGQAAGDRLTVVLTDIRLPDMLGPEVVLRLRIALDRPDLPAVYMSADGPEERARWGVDEAAEIIVQKPFAHGALRQAVYRALGQLGSHAC